MEDLPFNVILLIDPSTVRAARHTLIMLGINFLYFQLADVRCRLGFTSSRFGIYTCFDSMSSQLIKLHRDVRLRQCYSH